MTIERTNECMDGLIKLNAEFELAGIDWVGVNRVNWAGLGVTIELGGWCMNGYSKLTARTGTTMVGWEQINTKQNLDRSDLGEGYMSERSYWTGR